MFHSFTLNLNTLLSITHMKQPKWTRQSRAEYLEFGIDNDKNNLTTKIPKNYKGQKTFIENIYYIFQNYKIISDKNEVFNLIDEDFKTLDKFDFSKESLTFRRILENLKSIPLRHLLYYEFSKYICKISNSEKTVGCNVNEKVEEKDFKNFLVELKNKNVQQKLKDDFGEDFGGNVGNKGRHIEDLFETGGYTFNDPNLRITGNSSLSYFFGAKILIITNTNEYESKNYFFKNYFGQLIEIPRKFNDGPKIPCVLKFIDDKSSIYGKIDPTKKKSNSETTKPDIPWGKIGIFSGILLILLLVIFLYYYNRTNSTNSTSPEEKT